MADETDYPHSGRVSSLTDHFDSNVPSVPCDAILDKTDVLAEPGMSVRVRLKTGTTHDTFAVLRQAIFKEQAQSCIYVVNEQNVVQRRAVEVGQGQGDLLNALTGVKRNEIVVADPSAVEPGMSVKPDFLAGILLLPTPPIEFVETPFKDVVEYLKDAAHIEIHIDERGLAAAGIKPDVEITTSNIRGISFASALRLMLRHVGLTCVVEDEYILITVPGKEPGANAAKAKVEGTSQGTASPQDGGKAGFAAPLPTVRATQPVDCNVCDYEEYTGKIEDGYASVRIPLPRGRFEKTYFGSGATVREGDVLGEFVPFSDPKIQQAEEAVRAAIHAENETASSNDRAKYDAANAQEKAAKDELERAIRAAPHIKIVAPFSGKLGLDHGGGGGEHPLVGSITPQDAMLVAFDIPESAVLRIDGFPIANRAGNCPCGSSARWPTTRAFLIAARSSSSPTTSIPTPARSAGRPFFPTRTAS